MVNGVFERSAHIDHEAAAQMPYPMGLNLKLNGRSLINSHGAEKVVDRQLVTFESQSYDFRCGELHSRFRLADSIPPLLFLSGGHGNVPSYA